ncbi:MAG: hypothetical protein WB014_16265 [Methanosarcina sp.]
MSTLFFLIGPAGFSQGNLLVTPKRLVFEGVKRSADLNIANIGKDTATYAISFVQIRMNEDGSFEQITTPDEGQLFADKNLRFFPRSVTLAPNESQVIKVQLLKQNQLSAGEYRSHIYFRAVPKRQALGEKEKLIDSTAIAIRLTPIFGITIPAIIRIGEPDVQVTLSELAFVHTGDGSPALDLKFNRTGKYSVYGDLAVDHVAPDGTVTRIGVANGLAVYTPTHARRFQLVLASARVNYEAGKLMVTFSAPSDVKPERYAEAELILK